MPADTPTSLLSGSAESKLLGFRRRVVAIYTLLAIANIGAWIWAIAAFIHQPVLLGTALLAYSLGLRHAIDADHIAAIDNVTRKLMQQGQRPAAVGFFFSFGHSLVVILMAAAVTLATRLLESQFDNFKAVGAIIGTSVSAFFLFAVAVINT